MIIRTLTRRLLLLGAALTVAAACAAGGSMTTPPLSGTITYGAKKVLPAGRLTLVIEDTADPAAPRPEVLAMDSDGRSDRLTFVLPEGALPADLNREGVEIVAYLDRPDGTMIARGSVPLPWSDPVVIDLATVMY